MLHVVGGELVLKRQRGITHMNKITSLAIVSEDNFIDETWRKVNFKMEKMVTQMKGKSPHKSVSGIYDDMRLDWWTSGFWPGSLWIM